MENNQPRTIGYELAKTIEQDMLAQISGGENSVSSQSPSLELTNKNVSFIDVRFDF